MGTPLLVLAALTLSTLGALALLLAIGQRSIRFFERLTPIDSPRPRVSIVIAALNEERNIETALQSVIAQDYDNLEIIVIDDRSTDRTGRILDAMAPDHPTLRVIHITELPEGWLGKNHALWRGASEATGEILLFTDADVIMDPTAVSRAAGHMTRCGLDHLTALPQVIGGTFMTRMLIHAFGVFFTLFLMPWRAANPRSRRFAGIGAFNMVRREAYLACGTHRAIAMRPDDDVKLGKLLKMRGFRQEFVFGRGILGVEWYATVGGMIRGLTKNAFAGVEYRITAILGATLFLFGAFVWPWLGLLLTAGPARLFNALAVALIYLICREAARFQAARPSPWPGLFFPLSTLIFIYILWRSMVLTLAQGGIEWRGTRYPLDKLKANRI